MPNPSKEQDEKQPSLPQNQDKKQMPGSSKIEGEGSYEATRRYNQDVRDFVKSGEVEEKARDAKNAVEGTEGDALKDAEQQGKSGKVPM